MKHYLGLFLLGCACAAGLLSLIGDDSISHMRAMERSLSTERAQNRDLERHVQELRASVRGLRTDDRALEKAARNELGMVRPNEFLFVFEKSSDGGEGAPK